MTPAFLRALRPVAVPVACLLFSTSALRRADAQTAAATSGFVAGSRELYALSLASVAAGSMPKGMRLLKGKPTIVTKDGVQMLKAAEPTEFLVSLTEPLPDGFTIEFDIITKACCNPEDLSFEGTPAMSRSSASMNVVWHPETLIAAGGGEYVQVPMPLDIKETLPSQPAQIQASFQGTAFKLFTNGRQVLSLPNRQFVRGRVLRVFLGGQDDDQHAVYLSRLRIAASTGTVATVSGSSALSGDLASGATGTISEVTGTRPIATNVGTPTTTSVAVPTSPGVTSGPLPAGTTTTSSAVATATQTTLSSPTNPLPVVSKDSTVSQQNAVGSGRPGIQTVTAPIATAPQPTTASGIAGPKALTASPIQYGWGAMLKWPPVANASTYWVTRKVTSASTAGALTDVLFVPELQTASTVIAVDPYVDPGLTYTYWVQAFIPGAGFTTPSPIVMFEAGPAPFPPDLLRASVGGTTMLTMPGPLASKGSVAGSSVTWTWDPTKAFVYQVSYEIVGGVPGVGPVFLRMIVPTTGADPKPAPVTLGVPQGSTVKFCVHVYGSADRTLPLPTNAVCRTTTVP